MGIGYEFERSVVAVLVDGEVNGTGVVIAPGKVLTCAHVLGPHDPVQRSTKPLAIQFYASHPAFRGSNTTAEKASTPTTAASDVSQPVSVSVDWNNYSEEDVLDLAVLSWQATLPAEVAVARMSLSQSLEGIEICARGYPELGDFSSLPGVGRITGKVPHDASGQFHWGLESTQITGGFSGGPVFRKDNGEMIGLARVATRPDGNWRLNTTAIAISVQSIRKICGSLIEDQSAEIAAHHQKSLERLKTKLVEQFETSEFVWKTLWDSLRSKRVTGCVGVANGPSMVAESLISSRVPVNEFVECAIESYRACVRVRDRKAQAAITEVYVLVLAAILDPDLIRDVRTKLFTGERFFCIPYSVRPIFEIVMAGVEGRLGRFKPDSKGKKRRLPINVLEFNAAERGIETRGRLPEDKFKSELADHLGCGIERIPSGTLNQFLNGILKRRFEDQESVYMIQGHDKPRLSSEMIEQIQKDYPDLVIAELSKGSGDTLDAEIAAMVPWLNGDLPIKAEKKK